MGRGFAQGVPSGRRQDADGSRPAPRPQAQRRSSGSCARRAQWLSPARLTRVTWTDSGLGTPRAAGPAGDRGALGRRPRVGRGEVGPRVSGGGGGGGRRSRAASVVSGRPHVPGAAAALRLARARGGASAAGGRTLLPVPDRPPDLGGPDGRPGWEGS